jgi:hypothetical protein
MKQRCEQSTPGGELTPRGSHGNLLTEMTCSPTVFQDRGWSPPRQLPSPEG